jgi:hypothetical protein
MESTYLNNIVQIRDKKTNLVVLKERCTIQKIASMYSNTKTPIYKLVIDGKPISRNNTYTIRYKCHTCCTENEITLNLYMRKVNKASMTCDACKNSDEAKCIKQSNFMKQNASLIHAGKYVSDTDKTKVKNRTLSDHLETSITDWNQEDDDFKEKYYLYHLTSEDYERIKKHIISINNDKFNNINEWTYFPTYRIYNQTKYTPMLLHSDNKCVEKPLYLKFKCENCDCEYIHRDLEVVKNKYKLLCKTCSLVNKTFSLRKKILNNGEKIMWQSIPERRFIEWCEDNNIPIKNGPKLKYTFKEKEHTYHVDFELYDNILVEIKDNHFWHKQQIESGKFQAKQYATEEWCKKNNYTYHVIFPKTLQKFKDSIKPL